MDIPRFFRIHPIWYIVALAFILRLGWALVIPFNEAPDETLHFDQVKFIYDALRLPVFGPDQDLFVDERFGIHYAAYPGLNYILSALMLFLIPVPFEFQYLGARILSVLCGTATVYVSYLIAKELYPSRPMVVFGVPVLLCLLPMFVYVGSYINSDAYTALVCSLIIYAWLYGKKTGWNLQACVFLGLAGGLVLFGKYNGYVMLLMTPLAIFALVKGKWKAIRVLLTAASVAALCSGWWFIRSYYLYKNPLGFSVVDNIDSSLNWGPRSVAEVYGRNLWQFIFNTNWFNDFFISFWGLFDWFDQDWITLPFTCYYITFVICVVVFGYLAAEYIIKIIQRKQVSHFMVLMAWLPLLSLLLIIYTLWYNDYLPAGRYLFPSIVPFSIFLLLGFDKIIKNRWVPKKGCMVLILLFFCFLVYTNMAAYWSGILPSYSLWSRFGG